MAQRKPDISWSESVGDQLFPLTNADVVCSGWNIIMRPCTQTFICLLFLLLLSCPFSFFPTHYLSCVHFFFSHSSLLPHEGCLSQQWIVHNGSQQWSVICHQTYVVLRCGMRSREKRVKDESNEPNWIVLQYMRRWPNIPHWAEENPLLHLNRCCSTSHNHDKGKTCRTFSLSRLWYQPPVLDFIVSVTCSF